MAGVIFDLFGDPVPEGRGRPGRPAHVATVENRNRVKMLLAVGWADERIAGVIGVSLPTLRKHYFHELKARGVQRDRLEARRLTVLWALGVESGNVAALKEFDRLLDAQDLAAAAKKFDGAEPPKPKLGKKEQALVDAETAGADDPEWGDLLGRSAAIAGPGGLAH